MSNPELDGMDACGLSIVVFSFRIPFTRYHLALEKVIVDDAEPDEVAKELTLRGFFKRRP